MITPNDIAAVLDNLDDKLDEDVGPHYKIYVRRNFLSNRILLRAVDMWTLEVDESWTVEPEVLCVWVALEEMRAKLLPAKV